MVAKDIGGAADPCKSISCSQDRESSVTNAMKDKLKIKITSVLADLIFFFYLEVPCGKINQIRTFPRNFLFCLFITMSSAEQLPCRKTTVLCHRR